MSEVSEELSQNDCQLMNLDEELDEQLMNLDEELDEQLMNLDEELDEQLTCKSCSKQYVNPKVLPCLHTVCLECIAPPDIHVKDGKQYLTCPCCKAIHQCTNARSLPDALFIIGQIELRNELSRNTVRRDTKIKCPDHMNSLKVYCETCDKAICRDCTISESHSTHKYKLISECFTEHRQEIMNELLDIEKRMKDIGTSITLLMTRKETIVNDGEEIKDEIQLHTRQVIEQAERSERNLLHQLDNIVEKKTSLLCRQKKEAEKVLKQLKTCKELIEQRLNEWSEQQIIIEKHRMMNRMKRLSETIGPTKFLALEKSDLEFIKSCTTESSVTLGN